MMWPDEVGRFQDRDAFREHHIFVFGLGTVELDHCSLGGFNFAVEIGLSKLNPSLLTAFVGVEFSQSSSLFN
jgi:hypothetical protein